jgi:hypothetical protein
MEILDGGKDGHISESCMKKMCTDLKNRLKMAASLKNKILNGGHIEKTSKLRII